MAARRARRQVRLALAPPPHDDADDWVVYDFVPKPDEPPWYANYESDIEALLHHVRCSSLPCLVTWFNRFQQTYRVTIVICLFAVWLPLIRDSPSPSLSKIDQMLNSSNTTRKSDMFRCPDLCCCLQNRIRWCLSIVRRTWAASHWWTGSRSSVVWAPCCSASEDMSSSWMIRPSSRSTAECWSRWYSPRSSINWLLDWSVDPWNSSPICDSNRSWSFKSSAFSCVCFVRSYLVFCMSRILVLI